MLFFLFLILFIFVAFLGFNRQMGYRKGNITFELDERYTDLNEYVKAVTEKLENQGRTVQYTGYREFIIDGEKYLLQETNIPMGSAPLQRTILKRDGAS